MTNNELTFNDLPQVVAELRDEVSGMKALLLNLQNRPTLQRENRHRPVTPEQVAERVENLWELYVLSYNTNVHELTINYSKIFIYF